MSNYVIIVLKNIYLDIKTYFRGASIVARIQSQNPTCKFYSESRIENTTFGLHNVIFEGVHVFDCKIESHTYIQENSRIHNADIGKFCSIASNVTIGPGIHETDRVSTHPAFYLKNTPLQKIYGDEDLFCPTAKISIGNDVWIGKNAIIMDGINVGNGAIIAAGAVVVKNIEPYSIVGGVPAKHIRFRFEQQIISELEKSKWWEYPEEWFEKRWSLMSNINEFINYLRCLEKD